jgi:hypothetical protein
MDHNYTSVGMKRVDAWKRADKGEKVPRSTAPGGKEKYISRLATAWVYSSAVSENNFKALH